MKAWQKRITSLSDLPLGSKSEPPLAPPIGVPVKEFLKICSKPKNFKTLHLQSDGSEDRPCKDDGGVELYAIAAIYLDLSFVVNPLNAEGESSLRLNNAL